MTSDHKLVVKDAIWQLFWRIISAVFGFFITKIISSYLGPARYGDYGTIFRYFAWWTALVDFWIYVIAVRRLGEIKENQWDDSPELKDTYHKFLGTRVFMIIVVYTLAIIVAYLIPAYTDNPFFIWGLPLAMIYSASNMFVGLQQLPLQLFWKMNRLSRSLIIARLSQLVILLPAVFYFFKEVSFDSSDMQPTSMMIVAFCTIIFSVVASAIGQNIDVHLKSKSLLPFKIKIDRSFIKNLLSTNRKYGFAYFFSSFHTLIVLMFMGRIFPSTEGFEYTWYWALSLSLIELLLIIPSALGNSLLHKIPNYPLQEKQKSLGNLLNLVIWIGGIIAINFWIFNSQIISLVSSDAFLGSWDNRWSDQILPFLWIVLVLSFVKQVFNYLFVAVNKQTLLFYVNLIGIVCGIILALFVIPKRNLIGGVITQITLECLFTIWAIFMAEKEKIFPLLNLSILLKIIWILLLFWGIWICLKYFFPIEMLDLFYWIERIDGMFGKFLNVLFFCGCALIINLPILLLSYSTIKKVAKGLTKKEVPWV